MMIRRILQRQQWNAVVVRGFIAIALVLALDACGSDADVEHVYPRPRDGRGSDPSPEGPRETIFGPGGFSLDILGGDKKKSQGPGEAVSGVGVNSFLWRASLDTMSFMPLTSADPFGGVIITDWYTPPETPDERFKATVYILERQLRANGIRVSVFRQSRANSDHWRDVAMREETAVALENAILTRARQLRVSAVGSQ